MPDDETREEIEREEGRRVLQHLVAEKHERDAALRRLLSAAVAAKNEEAEDGTQ